MKVASISHMFPNSVNPTSGVFVKERLKHVSKIIDLSIIAPVPSFPFMNYTSKYAGLQSLPAEELIDGLIVYHPRYFMIPKYFKFLDAFFYSTSMSTYIHKMCSRKCFDILDFHWVFPDGIGGLSWARELGIKTVVTVRGNEAIYYFDKNIPKLIVQKKLSEFDHIISVSSDLKNKMVSEYHVDPSKVTVIQNGIDSSKFYRRDAITSKKHCQINDHKYILTVCRLSHEKGLEHLLKSISILNDRNIKLILVGSGPIKNVLLNLCDELKISRLVQFVDTLNHHDLCYWYNAVDVFCLPSLWEGCPNVIIEALACGTPVVATRVGGIPDLIPGNDYGILVPPGDANSLAAALDSALSRDWNRQKISAFGSANSWDDVASKVVNVFKGVLS